MSQTSNGRSGDKKNAHILAIGTANPPNYILQADYPDFYFNITNSNHMVDLKDKFTRICEKSKVRKRYFHLTEKILKANPGITTYGAPSLESRQQILEVEIPKLGAEAATIALKEWGRPLSDITHVVFATTSGFMMPGADYALTKLLKLSDNVRRVMLYCQGCFAGGAALRVARDMAENNKDARVLVVCGENTTMTFHAPNENHLDVLVGQAIFSDGAAAMVVGADLKEGERGLFEMLSAHQMIVPNSENAITSHFYEMGMTYFLKQDVVALFRENMEYLMKIAFEEHGITDWTSLFYAIHPGGRAIIDAIAENLGLTDDNMLSSRHVLSEYGNMGATSVVFILDELRRRAIEEKKLTTGDGLEYGCLLGLGPGLTVECVVLKSCPTA